MGALFTLFCGAIFIACVVLKSEECSAPKGSAGKSCGLVFFGKGLRDNDHNVVAVLRTLCSFEGLRAPVFLDFNRIWL